MICKINKIQGNNEHQKLDIRLIRLRNPDTLGLRLCCMVGYINDGVGWGGTSDQMSKRLPLTVTAERLPNNNQDIARFNATHLTRHSAKKYDIFFNSFKSHF